MATETIILENMRKQLVAFMDELIETYPDESDFILYRILLKDQLPITLIMEYVCDQLLPLKKQIEEKNEDFFMNNNILFKDFSDESHQSINYMKNIWKSCSDENKEIMWKWFQLFLRLSERYIEVKNS